MIRKSTGKLVVLVAGILCATMLVASGIIYLNHRADAVYTQKFNPENIISDYIFTDYNSMSASEIQNFLVSKSSVCLKNFKTLSLNDQNGDGLGDEPYGKGINEKVSAATLIWQAAQLYHINPKVILVTLQKEQSLITGTDCSPWRYNTALGYGCPDTAPCDDSAYGFTRQIDYGVWHFRGFFDDTYPIPPTVPGTKSIAYNPDSRCGGKTITIRNRATAALYSYTPYQPNAYALNGGTDSKYPNCGAFGNLNFWKYFTNWFGSTQAKLDVSAISFDNNPFTDAPVTASFTLKNTSNSNISLNTMLIAVRGPNGEFLDFPTATNVVIKPGNTYTYSKTKTFNGPEGQYRIFIAYYDGTSWHTPAFEQYDQPNNSQTYVNVYKKPTLTSSLAITPSSSHVNSTSTATFKIKNNSAFTQNLGYVGAAVRDTSGAIYDYPFNANLTLTAGQEYTYTASRTFPHTGKYDVFVFNKIGNYKWNRSYPEALTSSISKETSINAKDSVTLTQPLSVTMSQLYADNDATASFKIKNYSVNSINVGTIGVAVRDSKGNIYDFPFESGLVLAPGQEYTYSETRTLPNAGSYRMFITDYRAANGWDKNYPENEDTSYKRERGISLKDSVVLSAPLSVTPSPTHKDSVTTATFKIKNHGTHSANIDVIGAAVRDSKGNIYDFPFESGLVLAPGQEYTYSETRTLPNIGNYSVFILNKRGSGAWSKTYPTGDDPAYSRSQNIAVKDSVALTNQLAVTMTKQYAGNTATASFELTNYSTKSINVGNIGAAVRGPDGNIYDFPFVSNLTLSPGQVYQYSKSRTLPVAGDYRIFITDYRTTVGWNKNYPENESSNQRREVILSLKDQVTLLSSLTVSPSLLTPTTTISANFVIRNNGPNTITIPAIGAAVRDSKGNIYDFPFELNLVLTPDQEHTYNESRILPYKGSYEVFVLSKQADNSWSKTSPGDETNLLTRSSVVTVR